MAALAVVMSTSPRRLAIEAFPQPLSESVARRRIYVTADMSSTRITDLDRRLYAWLGEADEARFNSAFNAYFSVAFPSVVRHLARMSRFDQAQLEELAQDALLRFFDRVGRERRAAADAVRGRLQYLKPLNFGAFHKSRVLSWAADVSLFRDSCLQFNINSNAEWKDAIRLLLDSVGPLQRKGGYVIADVSSGIGWQVSGDALQNCSADDSENCIAAARTFARLFADELVMRTARALTALEQHPGVAELTDGSVEIIDALPRLRVPTNGYLFEIATNLYIDECKKRGRLKRGGQSRNPASYDEWTKLDSVDPHPVEDLSIDEYTMHGPAPDQSPFLMLASDPTAGYEQEDLFEKFYAYLRKPVDDAMRELVAAADTRAEKACRLKLQSMTAKFERMMAVLTWAGEGFTQEQTAEELGISRNQVKYVLELVQAAYARFAATISGSSQAAARRSEVV